MSDKKKKEPTEKLTPEQIEAMQRAMQKKEDGE